MVSTNHQVCNKKKKKLSNLLTSSRKKKSLPCQTSFNEPLMFSLADLFKKRLKAAYNNALINNENSLGAVLDLMITDHFMTSLTVDTIIFGGR